MARLVRERPSGIIINTMAMNDAKVKREEQTRKALRTLGDALILAEPLQLRLWRSSGMTLTQLRILRLVRDGLTSPGQLAQTTGVLPASLTRMLDRLEAQGLIERRTHACDRRRIEVVLLDAGLKAIGDNQIFRGSVFAQAMDTMSDEEQLDFIRAVSLLVERVKHLGGTEGSGSKR